MNTLKTKLAIGAVTVSLALGSILPSASYAMRVETLDDTYGKAAKVEQLANGDEVRYFEIMSGTPGLAKFNEYRVFEVQKDGIVLDKGFYKGSLDRTASSDTGNGIKLTKIFKHKKS